MVDARTLRKLVRSIYIVGPYGDKRQLETTPIRADHHLCCSFASRVRIRRGQYTRLAQVRCTNRHIAIHLIRRDMYEPVHAMFPGSLQQHMRPVYIRVGKFVRVAKAQVDMRLRCEVKNGVNLVLAKHAFHVGWRCDVAIFKREVFLLIEDPRVVEGRAVVELVERDDVVMARICENEMADEPTGTAFVSVYFRCLSL
jgi:hypothetical protein